MMKFKQYIHASVPSLSMIWSIVLLGLLLSSCTKVRQVAPDPDPNGVPQRTLLAYFAGDNNLSNEARTKTTALLSGWKPSMGPLLILVDDLSLDRPVLIRATMKGSEVMADTLREYSYENSAAPELMREVIQDMQLIAPAMSYGMILFSHATGWLPTGAYEQKEHWHFANKPSINRSLIVDNDREMELSDFVDALPDDLFTFIAS